MKKIIMTSKAMLEMSKSSFRESVREITESEEFEGLVSE